MTDWGPLSPAPDGRGRSRPLLVLTSRIIETIAFTGKLIAVVTLSFMFVALLANVILRYWFDGGIAWAYEIHAVLLPWLVAAGILVAASRGTNIAITILPDALPAGARRILLVAIEAVIILISVSVLLSSQPILKASQFQTLSTLGIKQIWGYASLVYAFAGMAVISALEILRILAGASVFEADYENRSLS